MPRDLLTVPTTRARRAGRPRLVVGALALLIVVAMAATACGSSADPNASGSAGSAPEGGSGSGWTFTDSNGTTHHLDEVPDTIAAQSIVAGGLWELGVVADGVFGPLRRPDGSPDPSIGLAPPDAFTSLGEVDSQINVEALAALQPDIIVAPMWDNGDYWGIAPESTDVVEQIAPVVAIRVDHRPVSEPLGVVADLAESLGVDLDQGEPAAARASFERASNELRAALAANPDLRVGALSGTRSELYVAYAPAFPDLRYFEDLGMDIVEPETHETSGGYWETLSWEQAGKYAMDLVIVDARSGTVEEVRALLPPTAASLPSIVAGQITSWKTTHALGYGNVAENLDALTAAVEAAEPLDI
jgi:iron complex transport system substrate-binding protein